MKTSFHTMILYLVPPGMEIFYLRKKKLHIKTIYCLHLVVWSVRSFRTLILFVHNPTPPAAAVGHAKRNNNNIIVAVVIATDFEGITTIGKRVWLCYADSMIILMCFDMRSFTEFACFCLFDREIKSQKSSYNISLARWSWNICSRWHSRRR